ncbi:hypothetical protein N0V88_000969 [Collariella sp. IMI 366227]|nr:hypothetical protein N0V88_000969 [Collariella sp. IMI 366227]
MTSSVLDGAGCESPAPPAFSPLTDADPGNREPSEMPQAEMLDHAQSAVRDRAAAAETCALDGDAVPSTAATASAARSALPLPNVNSQHNPDSDPKPEPDPTAGLPTAVPTEPHTIDGDAMDIDSAAIDAQMAFPPLDNGFDLYPQQDPHQLLMALAQLSTVASRHVPNYMFTPSTVHPSQVSMPPQAMLDNPVAPDPLVPATPDNTIKKALHVDTPLESFARIEFADSVFQMTTYAVIIGRDQRALDQARRDERRVEEYQRRVRENEQLGLPAPSPPMYDRGKFSKSYVSEEGGMLGPESDDDNPRPTKKRKATNGPGSASGNSHQQEDAAGEQAALEEKNAIANRQYVSHTPGAAAVNLGALRPSPHTVAFVGIHSPGPNIASRTKAISREHLKIQFNQKEGVFEAIPMHKNGFFCEDVHYKDDRVVLKSGDRLQIKDVDFVFIINGVPHGKTGAEEGFDEDGVPTRRYSEGGKEMSFDFESTHVPERRSTSPEDNAVEAVKEESDSELSEPGEDIAEPEPEDTPEADVMETIEKDAELAESLLHPDIPPEILAELPPIPKKRGPGRPPKNGIMSKREERGDGADEEDFAAATPPGEPPIKRKVGRPRKHPLPENTSDRPEKRKYKPRKSKNGEDGEISGAEKTIKERRREKPKTPPLELNRDDYTEEQLTKPTKNYGILIDEVLSAAPQGLTLKQIYKRIQMKYPFFYFAVDTKGWESSVRHNLIGNVAFEKNDETHLWRRVPGIDIDAGKKRKATSPERSASLHTFGQHYSASPTSQMFHTEGGMQQGYRPGSVPQRTPYPPGHGQMSLGQHQQPHPGAQAAGAAAQLPPRLPYQTNPQPSGAAPTPGGVAKQNLPPNHEPGSANGPPRVNPSVQAGAPGSVGARPAPPAPANGTTLTLKPAVAPELLRHITNFKTTVTDQLIKRTKNAEAVAMSVINRGLGLASESTIPDEESLEKIVLGVFESSRKNLGANQALHPGLVQALVNFKNNMIKTLEPKMGKLNAERLILSAVDRVLGFADRSTMPGETDVRKQYDEAEIVLIPAIHRVVTEHQRTLAATRSYTVGVASFRS